MAPTDSTAGEARDPLGGRVTAPFTASQVESLNAYQRSGVFHEFTCQRHHACGKPAFGGGECVAPVAVPLLATEAGWVCPHGDGYTQLWAHGFMADWSWKQSERKE
jgi:hypothetical protein